MITIFCALIKLYILPVYVYINMQSLYTSDLYNFMEILYSPKTLKTNIELQG